MAKKPLPPSWAEVTYRREGIEQPLACTRLQVATLEAGLDEGKRRCVADGLQRGGPVDVHVRWLEDDEILANQRHVREAQEAQERHARHAMRLEIIRTAAALLPGPLPRGDFYAADYAQGRYALASLAQLAGQPHRHVQPGELAPLIEQLAEAIWLWPAPARELWPEVFPRASTPPREEQSNYEQA